MKEVICGKDNERPEYAEAMMAITVDESLKRLAFYFKSISICILSCYFSFQLYSCSRYWNAFITFKSLLSFIVAIVNELEDQIFGVESQSYWLVSTLMKHTCHFLPENLNS